MSEKEPKPTVRSNLIAGLIIFAMIVGGAFLLEVQDRALNRPKIDLFSD